MGIALGVGIVVAVELINNSALSSFAASVDFLSGRATHSIVSDYGRIEEGLFTQDCGITPAVDAASPVIQVMATTLETGDEPIRFFGVDPFLDTASFAPCRPWLVGKQSLTGFLTSDIPGLYLSERNHETLRTEIG